MNNQCRFTQQLTITFNFASLHTLHNADGSRTLERAVAIDVRHDFNDGTSLFGLEVRLHKVQMGEIIFYEDKKPIWFRGGELWLFQFFFPYIYIF